MGYIASSHFNWAYNYKTQFTRWKLITSHPTPLGNDFEITPVPESFISSELSSELIVKKQHLTQQEQQKQVILKASVFTQNRNDTLLVCDGDIFQKPVR